MRGPGQTLYANEPLSSRELPPRVRHHEYQVGPLCPLLIDNHGDFVILHYTIDDFACIVKREAGRLPLHPYRLADKWPPLRAVQILEVPPMLRDQLWNVRSHQIDERELEVRVYLEHCQQPVAEDKCELWPAVVKANDLERKQIGEPSVLETASVLYCSEELLKT